MSLRPSLVCATRRAASIPSIICRSFTSTSSVASPPREPPHPLRHTTPVASSTSNLLSIDNDHSARPNSSNATTGNNSASPAASYERGEAASRMLNRYKDRAEAAMRNKQAQVDFLRNRKVSDDYLKQMPRKWGAGDVYSPHDLSPVEMQKWRRKAGRTFDVIDALSIRPLDMYKNFSLAQEFTTSSGQIAHSSVTQLRPVNQRKVAKMIRRIQGMGIYPTIHDHPEQIRNEFFPDKFRK